VTTPPAPRPGQGLGEVVDRVLDRIRRGLEDRAREIDDIAEATRRGGAEDAEAVAGLLECMAASARLLLSAPAELLRRDGPEILGIADRMLAQALDARTLN